MPDQAATQAAMRCFSDMEDLEPAQLPRVCNTPKESAVSSRLSNEDIGFCREVTLPPPRSMTPQTATPFDNSALAQRMLDMQRQLADIVDIQGAIRLNVEEIHSTINALVAKKSNGSRLDRAGYCDVIVQEQRDGTVSSATSHYTYAPTGDGTQGDHPWHYRPPARTHAVLPFPRKRSQTIADMKSPPILPRARSQESRRPSINSFGSKDTTQREDMDMLWEIFRTSEDRQADGVPTLYLSGRAVSWLGFSSASKHRVGVMLNSLSGVLIALNAIFIGLRLDHADDDEYWWTAIDEGFTALFTLEIGLRIWMSGLCQHFCGSSKYANIFDAVLVFIDVVQQISVRTFRRAPDNSEFGPSASLFRVARLGKLARMLHLLRLNIFTDLLTMMQGLWGGLATLGWSMVLCAVAIYIVALFFRELFGTGDVPNVTDYFSSVPRSMFTTFRCSFGDCTSNKGVPVFEYVLAEYGSLAALLYCFYFFVITIGLFNVISAVFVESTMNAASSMHAQNKKKRLRDHDLWCVNVGILVKRLMAISQGDDSGHGNDNVKLTDSIRDVYFFKAPCSAIDDLAQDPEAICAFSALDIASEDRDYLSDILDPDNSGTIHIIELIEGLRRLRGDPRRSDIVTVNLMLRSIQRDLAEVFDAFKEMKTGEARSSSTSAAGAQGTT